MSNVRNISDAVPEANRESEMFKEQLKRPVENKRSFLTGRVVLKLAYVGVFAILGIVAFFVGSLVAVLSNG